MNKSISIILLLWAVCLLSACRIGEKLPAPVESENQNTGIAEETAETHIIKDDSVYMLNGDIEELQGIFLMYAAVMDDATICFVGYENENDLKAIFYDVKNKEVISNVPLDNSNVYFSSLNGNLICAEKSKKKDGKCTVINRKGEILKSFVYVDEKVAGSGNSILADSNISVNFNSESDDMLYLSYIPGKTAATYHITSANGEKNELEFLSDEKFPLKIDNFSGKNIFILNSDDEKSILTLWDLNGKVINEVTLGSNKNSSCRGHYAVIFDQKNLSGISSDNNALLLDCLTGNTTELTFGTKTENQWCIVSSDGKYVLTLDSQTQTFRLYETADSSLIKEFNVSDYYKGIFFDKFFIDSKNRTVYFQTIKDDVCGVYAENF